MQITINNKPYGLSWGLGAIEIYCDKMGCGMEGLDLVFAARPEQALLKSKALVNLILAALQNSAELENKEFDVTYRQLQAWIDEAPQALFQSVMKDFETSKYFGKTIGEYLGIQAEEVPATSKKKSHSAKSSS